MPQRRGRWAGYGDYRGVKNSRRSWAPRICCEQIDEFRECGKPAIDGVFPSRCVDHVKRVPLNQSPEWDRRREIENGCTYAEDRCCYCYRPVRSDTKRIMLTRTNDGEWWAVHPLASVRDDERHMGDPHFALPIGPDCLRAHPELRFAIVGGLP